MSLKALAYLGGKSPDHSVGRWIAGLLPYRKAYIEPFSGMCGVLLQRQESPSEIINDRAELVYDFWRGIRDHAEALDARLEATPEKCRRTYFEAIGVRDNRADHDLVTRAWAASVILRMSMVRTTMAKPYHFYVEYDRLDMKMQQFRKAIPKLKRRMRNVQIENRDALNILERSAKLTDAVIYCDPPYAAAGDTNRGYQHKPEFRAMSEALQMQQGFVAVSGFSGDFDCLDWKRLELTRRNHQGMRREVTECLWVNRELETMPLFALNAAAV